MQHSRIPPSPPARSAPGPTPCSPGMVQWKGHGWAVSLLVLPCLARPLSFACQAAQGGPPPPKNIQSGKQAAHCRGREKAATRAASFGKRISLSLSCCGPGRETRSAPAEEEGGGGEPRMPPVTRMLGAGACAAPSSAHYCLLVYICIFKYTKGEATPLERILVAHS